MEQETKFVFTVEPGAMESGIADGRPGAPAVSPERAWLLSKDELRGHFGEGVYRSYFERLDLAFDGEDEREFLARDGGAQATWLNDQAREIIARRMNEHTRVFKPVRICGLRELSPKALESVRAHRLDAAPAAADPTPAPLQRWTGRFETLCEGAANHKAVMLGHLVAARSAQLRMVIFRGEPGVGKTHLCEALANEALEQTPGLKVRLVSGQQFSEEFLDHLNRKRDMAAFKAQMRDADLLIIDDIPRVAGRKQTEEELYDTIMSVYGRGGFVVLTAVAGQSGVAAFGDRLAHHLKCATECEIGLPDEAMRRDILKMRVDVHAAAHPGFAVAPEVIDMIAARMPVSGRELDGAIGQLMFEWCAAGQPITAEQAEAALRTRFGESARKVSVDMIKAAVAKHYQMSVAELMRKTREKAVSHPRQVAMHLSCQLTTLSLPNIARLFGGYDHTTVLYSKRKIARLLTECAELRRDVEEIKKLLRQSS